MFRIFKNVKQSLINWCLSKEEVQIGELHKRLQPTKCEIYNTDDEDELKFIEETTPSNLMVLTPSGYSPIKNTRKTVEYEVWKITTETGKELFCADKHIVINEYDNEVWVKDLINNKTRIKTTNGLELVTSVEALGYSEPMYDLELDDDDHVFYTNDIVSHNSIVSGAYLLWFSMFNFDKTVLIASNKNDNAMEMIIRIKFAYENLPSWIKPGVKDDGWNKHEIGFDNNSRIVSTATTAESGRGMSISLLYLDEFAFVPPQIAEEFWTSITPTLSTGGSCIMTSTPNGDVDIFSQVWRGANVGSNGFVPIKVEWDEPPGRDEKFKNEQIGKIGQRKWEQEYLCVFLSSDALLISSIVLQNMTKVIEEVKPVRTVREVTFFEEIKEGGTYLVGVDPATGNGEDFSVITIFEFPTLVQVAEYRSNSMSTSELYEILKNILLYLEQKKTDVFFSVENNGVGEGIIALYESDDQPPTQADFVSEDGKNRLGMTTVSRIKMRCCINLKEMVEHEAITIKSRLLLSELKTFIRRKSSYAAQRGSTDDCISALLIVIRLIEEIATYDQLAFEKLYCKDFDQWSAKDYDGYGDYDDDDEVLPMVF